MPHTPKEKKRALTRVRRIKGQVTALETLLEEGSECADVLQQIAAVRGAINGLMRQVLEAHLRETLGTGQLNADERHEALQEMSDFIKAYLK